MGTEGGPRIIAAFRVVQWGCGQKAEEHLARAVGGVRWWVLEGQGGLGLGVNPSHILMARDRLAKRRCAPREDGVTLKWIEAASDEVCGRFCLCWLDFVGITPQPVGWAFSQVPLLLQARARDRIDQLRSVGGANHSKVGACIVFVGGHMVGGRGGSSRPG